MASTKSGPKTPHPTRRIIIPELPLTNQFWQSRTDSGFGIEHDPKHVHVNRYDEGNIFIVQFPDGGLLMPVYPMAIVRNANAGGLSTFDAIGPDGTLYTGMDGTHLLDIWEPLWPEQELFHFMDHVADVSPERVFPAMDEGRVVLVNHYAKPKALFYTSRPDRLLRVPEELFHSYSLYRPATGEHNNVVQHAVVSRWPFYEDGQMIMVTGSQKTLRSLFGHNLLHTSAYTHEE